MSETPRDDLISRSGEHLSEERCVEILNGLVPASQLDTVVEHLKRCRRCEDLLRARAAEFERLRAGPMPRRLEGQGLVLIPREAEGGEETRPRWWQVFRDRRRPAWWPLVPARPLALGTVGLALVALALLVLGRGETAPPLHRLPGERAFLSLRSGEDVAGMESLREGIRAYAAGDYRRAVGILAATRAPEGSEDLRRLYLASALSLSGRYEEASRVLEELAPETLPQPYRDEALWIRYVVLWHTGSRREAETLLERLRGSPGEIGALARRHWDATHN
jgi:tetratricopeptide (TPR) repeat protein